MSFGWSVGDIVSALCIIRKVCKALKDSGGAEAESRDALESLQFVANTLETVRQLDHLPLKLEFKERIRRQCEGIRGPLMAFITELDYEFSELFSTRQKRLALKRTYKKGEWALRTNEKVTALKQELVVPMTAINLLLNHTALNAILEIPTNIRAEILQLLEESNTPRMISQKYSVSIVSQHHAFLTDLDRSQHMMEALVSNTQGNNINNALPVSSEFDISLRLMMIELWSLAHGLQKVAFSLLICTFLYISKLYQSTIYPALLGGDRFLFQDLLGRKSWLCCHVFSDWKRITRYLRMSFTDIPEITGVYLILNPFSAEVISQTNWRLAIQPRCKIVMEEFWQSSGAEKWTRAAFALNKPLLFSISKYGTISMEPAVFQTGRYDTPVDLKRQEIAFRYRLPERKRVSDVGAEMSARSLESNFIDNEEENGDEVLSWSESVLGRERLIA